MKKEGALLSYKSYIKPKLTEANAEWQLDYAWTEYELRGGLYYDKQYQVIHVDEKWIYLIEDGQRFYLAHDEKPPYISQQHKQSRPKVMFLCTLARPG